MPELVYILDNGHDKNTPGKRSPQIPPGVYEWEFNRDMVRRIMEKAERRGIKCINLVPEETKVTLRERVKRANAICKEYGAENCMLISIHANAYGFGKWNSARGVKAFVPLKASKKLVEEAEYFIGSMSSWWGTNNRGVSKKNYDIFKGLKCDGILLEHPFMTNKVDAKRLSNDKYRRYGVNAIITIMEYINQEHKEKPQVNHTARIEELTKEIEKRLRRIERLDAKIDDEFLKLDPLWEEYNRLTEEMEAKGK